VLLKITNCPVMTLITSCAAAPVKEKKKQPPNNKTQNPKKQKVVSRSYLKNSKRILFI